MAKNAAQSAIESSLVALVPAIHAAGGSDDQWFEVLGSVCDALDARLVAFGQHEFGTSQGAALYDAPSSPAFRRDYAAFAARNPWFLSSDDYVPGRVMSGEELLSNRELLRTDFYRAFLKPHALFHRLCGVVARRNDFVYFVTAHRGEDQEPFGARERNSLRFLLEHFSLALEHHWRFQNATDLARAMMRIVDQDPNAMLLVSPDGNLVYHNPVAGELLARRAALCVESAKLVTANTGDQRALRQAIRSVTTGAAGGGPDESRVVSLASANGIPPVVVIVRSAGDIFQPETGQRSPLALVTIRGGPPRHDPVNCSLAQQFELTPAQAKVSALMFTGQPLMTVARSLNVSENTIRSHLKQIFQKTNTHGQMELVHLHARLCTNRI
ncbi:MAG: helix-turn-helix transcriptional regulator [Burkholderiales bacterium]